MGGALSGRLSYSSAVRVRDSSSGNLAMLTAIRRASATPRRVWGRGPAGIAGVINLTRGTNANERHRVPGPGRRGPEPRLSAQYP